MENATDLPIPGLLTSAVGAAKAAADHGDSIGVLQNTAPKIEADILALTEAIDAYEKSKEELSLRRAIVREYVRDSRGLLTMGRDSFKPFLGSEYNEGWDITGLTGSLAIPVAMDDVQPLLRSFKAYLVMHPEHEVDPRDVTVGKFDELFGQLVESRRAVREQEVVADQKRQIRDEKVRQLRKRMRDLIEELNMLLGPLDARWKWFGFNMPGAQVTPDVPENLIATLINPTTAGLKWDTAPRTDYYRVWKKVVGVDEELVDAGDATHPNFTFESLPANATIELAVSAVNNGGESQKSEVARIVTH